MIYTPRPYQVIATRHIVDNPVTATDGAGLFLQMGLGKTASTLTAISELLFNFEIKKVLIVAPLLVAKYTWTDEIEKWDHLQHLRVSKVLGTEKQRKTALKAEADIYITNRENVVWLVAQYGLKFPFDMLVIDELSSFKSPKAARFKALKSIRPLIERVVGLTGTPAPNGMIDLWSQMFLLDRGKRLGVTLTGYREQYFTKEDYKPFPAYKLREDKDADDLIGNDYYQAKIMEKISDVCIAMKTREWLDLPPRIDTTRYVHFPEALKQQYQQFEREKVLELIKQSEQNEQGIEIAAFNAASLINKLLQFCNGAVYDDDKNYHEVHNLKIEALAEVLEEANGNPIIVAYQFRADVDRIKKHLKAFKPVHIHDLKDPIKAWNRGEVPVLLGHAASMGHGLNMQDGGNLITHFGVGWPLELYQQIVARIDRQGQTKTVSNSHLIVPDTFDTVVLDRLTGKAGVQDTVMDAVKVLVQKHS